MQQTVANSRLSSKTILLYVTLLLSLIGCAPEAIYEPELELKFNDIVVETTFTLKEYCKEKYDSIFIVQPYFDTKKEIFVDMNMSNGLRSLCSINTNSETISTILFIKDNKEYEIERYFENGAVRSNYILNDDEIVMSYEKYNTFFNTNYNEGNMNEFTPVDVEFKYYRNHDVNKEEVIYSANLKITKLIKGNIVYLNDKVFKEILSHNTFTLGLYFDDISNVSLISDVAFENGFSFNSII